jgi:DNA-binding beta-propeller fold protein YncE
MAPATAFAENPYWGYIYNTNKEDKPSLNGYLPLDSIDGYDMKSGPFKNPEDLFVAGDDTIYVTDTGNNRIVHFDAMQRVIGIYGTPDGPGKLNGPRGVFVTQEGDVYVADTQNRRIVIFDNTGAFKKDYLVPDSPLLGKDFVYSPSKLVVDKRGYMFVSSDGDSMGIMQIRPDGKFAGYFGANHVSYDWTRVIVKLIATKEQRDQMALVRPPEFSNLFQDSEGFIYTTTIGLRTNQVKRLSAVGVDTLNAYGQNRYGDLFMPDENSKPLRDAFVDVTVNNMGFITALDRTTGELYQYDKLGNLLFIFGGTGNQDGLFKTAAGVAETSDGTIYVTDKTRNRIERFYPTPFADLVHKASQLYVDGKYDEAFGPWKQVLELNSNYDMAYLAIGKSLFRQHKYEEAMKYFKLGGDRNSYSNALFEYRKVFIREHFGEIATSLIVVIIALVLLQNAIKRQWFASLRSVRRQPRKEEGINGSH